MRVRILWAAIGLVAGFGLAVFAAAWSISGSALFPPWYVAPGPDAQLRDLAGEPFAREVWMGVIKDPRADFGVAYEDVRFEAEDGLPLSGWFVPGAPGARAGVVTVHGAGADRRDLLRHLPVFHDAGYPVLLFDCREHGISGHTDRGIGLGVREHEDVSSAVAWMKQQRGLERVAVIGVSQGAASVLMAAGADPGIDAVVAESPFTTKLDLIRHVANQNPGASEPFVRLVALLVAARTGGLFTAEPLEAVAGIAPRPLLLIHGTADRTIPVEQSQRLFERAGEPKTLWIAENATHAAVYNAHRDAYRERVLAFLRESIGAAAGGP